jgi:Phage tail sheath C-terminal domain
MATKLQSPGVNVSVIDESFYTPSAPGTVPTLFVATAANKANASGTGTAQGTTEANVGKVWVMTSQRDLTDTFGIPVFPTDASGNPVHAGELNEYGLQAAYSVLGVSSRAYVIRADVDLASLSADTSIPTGKPVAGTYWVDTAHSLFGINEWDATSKKFTVKTPLIIDDSNSDTATDGYGTPLASFGSQGDYAVVVTKDNGHGFPNAVFYKNLSNTWNEVQTQNNNWSGNTLQLAVSPHYQYPDTSAWPTGSVWIKTTTPGYGADVSVKYYNGATQSWTSVSAPYYSSIAAAISVLDKNGGQNIPVNTVIIESDPDHYGIASTGTVVTSEFKLWRKNSTGATTISVTGASTAITQSSNSTFMMRATDADGIWSDETPVTVSGSTSTSVAFNIPAAISAAGVPNVIATFDPVSSTLSITHTLGGNIEFSDGTNNPLYTVGFMPYDIVSKSGTSNLYVAPNADGFDIIATNWKPLVYQAQRTTPVTTPADGTLWYDANLESVDILYNNGTQWVGYKDSSAFPLSNATGPIVSATQPTTQVTGDDLHDGDIWIDVSDVEMYGQNVYVFNGNTLAWDLQDVADHHSPNGWVFHDARWSGAGDDVAPDSIQKLLNYNYVDPDCVDPALYPKGTRLWNTRRSGFTVKKYMTGYIDTAALNTRFENDVMTGYNPDRWVSVTPLQEDGSGTFGRKAQRAYVVSKLKSEIDSNLAVRDTDTLTFNLLACPGYPETIQNLIGLNTDIGQTAFIVGDTSMRLEPTGTALANYGNNTANATDNGETALVSHDSYMAAFYPSGYTTDNAGNYIVVPPSHMMLRTIINSDAKSYPWFAPAGTRRGGVDNATSVGYVDPTGAFKPVSLYEGLRDVMSTVKINPIATLPGVGLVNMGQYTRQSASSALDRINVARLTAYLRRQLTILAKPFLFEPNDQQTRNEIKAAATSLLLELVGQRAIYDFLVVCDTTNNTPSRIDRNELYMDIAIEPVKAVEFIYIPLRLLNTGAISSGQLGSNFTGSTK